MEVEFSRGGANSRRTAVPGSETPVRNLTREELIDRLSVVVGVAHISAALQMLTDYVGASLFLLIRHELIQEQGLGSVVSSNWPFDLVRRVETELAELHTRSTELEKCISVLQPKFALLPDDVEPPENVNRQYCSMMFNVGRSRYSFMQLFPSDLVLSPEKLREVGLLASYCVSLSEYKAERSDREFELTERELECLFWIAEGKTSDEIAVILGISKNTINNYITSVMRKTATKTRSEAIAYAVRNNLV
ncbi:transcriptional regulator VisN [Agrobacterium sp. ES01]|uniref:transcriptional regulator VisN n=1 Tax=Agrobacterium sp. ES01 TaxID=3420714 RepID=UPI003D0AFCC1